MMVATNQISRRSVSLVTGWVLLAALLLLTGTAAVAEENPCASSRATDELLNCAHCQAVKKILGAENIGDLRVEIHDLRNGVIVQIDAANTGAVELAHELAREMWTLGRHEGLTMSKSCVKREGLLGQCFVDHALTETGVLVVISSEDHELSDWLREDARSTRGFVLSAASR